MVIAILECPAMLCKVLMSTRPVACSWVRNVWRSTCGVTPLQAMNTRINHTSERLSPEFPSGKIAKNRLYYYRCFRFGREVRKMLRVMLVDLWMSICNEQNVECSFR